MARFSKETLTKIAGFDGQVLSQELPFGNCDFWNMVWSVQDETTGETTPISLAGATIDALIVRRTIKNLEETRTGLSFDLEPYTGATSLSLPITNRVDLEGKFTVGFDTDTWNVLANDPELVIDVQNPVAFTGRVKIAFPANGNQPAYDESIMLLFLVRNDGAGV